MERLRSRTKRLDQRVHRFTLRTRDFRAELEQQSRATSGALRRARSQDFTPDEQEIIDEDIRERIRLMIGFKRRVEEHGRKGVTKIERMRRRIEEKHGRELDDEVREWSEYIDRLMREEIARLSQWSVLVRGIIGPRIARILQEETEMPPITPPINTPISEIEDHGMYIKLRFQWRWDPEIRQARQAQVGLSQSESQFIATHWPRS